MGLQAHERRITEGAWAFRPMKEAESLRAFRPGPLRLCGP
jgi:hypothetical protein